MRIKKLVEFHQVFRGLSLSMGLGESLDIVLEIAANEHVGGKTTFKQLTLAGIAPVSTLKRRLTKLIAEGIVVKQTDPRDGRVMALKLTPKTRRHLHSLADMLASFEW